MSLSHAPFRLSTRASRALSAIEQEDFDDHLRRLQIWYPHAPFVMQHQAAYMLASHAACSDALLITADTFRAYVAFLPDISVCVGQNVLDMAQHLVMKAPERARFCGQGRGA